MHPDPRPADPDTLRAQLTDPRPMQRALALHEIELAIERCPDDTAHARAAAEAARFAARGIPFYRPDDRKFLAWAERAVTLWQRLCEPPAVAGGRSLGS